MHGLKCLNIVRGSCETCDLVVVITIGTIAEYNNVSTCTTIDDVSAPCAAG